MPLKKGMKSLPSLDDFEEDYDSSDEYDNQEIYEDEYEDDYEEVHEDYEELDDNDFEDETYEEEEEYEEQHEVHEDYDYYSNSPKKKKGNKIILGLVIGGVLAILTSILVFVLFVTSNQNKEQPNNETSSVLVENSESISQNSEIKNNEEKNTNENNEQNESSSESESVASSSSEEQSVVASEESKPEEPTEKDESVTIDFVNNETDTIVLNVKTEKSMNINVQYSYIESNDNFVLCESGFQELEKGEREMALECLNNTENVQETQSKSPQTKIIKFKENS